MGVLLNDGENSPKRRVVSETVNDGDTMVTLSMSVASLHVGQVVEFRDSQGRRTAQKVISAQSATTITVRDLHWYESWWWAFRLALRSFRGWLVFKWENRRSGFWYDLAGLVCGVLFLLALLVIAGCFQD